ncbi:GDP-fucose protein O-fucosyltransferase 1-like [Lineus longissimus]|uniref:GDP-fucose protein O-fucosyltransferase 1-like n=1 Tax=Lineus longissimus TaxID=88925 RepID=UPI00315D27B1
MGRFGNQADHYLGALSFARAVNRTLVLPPFVEYRPGSYKSVQVPFKTYFEVDPIKQYHRVITMEDFMSELAPSIWPAGQRTAYCYYPRHGPTKGDCNAKDGNPFGPFWDTYSIDFEKSEFYQPLQFDAKNPRQMQKWLRKYPAEHHLVLAFVGAPANFPISEDDWQLQQYLIWNEKITKQGDKFIQEYIPEGPWIGIHLRNGVDWERTCEHINDRIPNMFASPQCIGHHPKPGTLTQEMCFPTTKTILYQVKELAKKTQAKTLFVAADSNHMIPEFEKYLKSLKIKVIRYEPSSPHLDLYLLAQADHFIANCVSTFSSFAKRERDINGRASSFWAYPHPSKEKSKPVQDHDEF